MFVLFGLCALVRLAGTFCTVDTPKKQARREKWRTALSPLFSSAPARILLYFPREVWYAVVVWISQHFVSLYPYIRAMSIVFRAFHPDF